MYIIGIDASLSNTGIIVLDENDNIREQVTIKTVKSDEDAKRLCDFYFEFHDFVFRYFIDNGMVLYAIEDYSYMVKNSKSLISLGEQGGLIRLILYMSGYKVRKYSPSALKKFITGKGNANKDLILKEVYKKYGVDFDDHNLADAYVIAKLRLTEWKIEQGIKSIKDFPKYQQEVLKKL